jgi:phosphatidylserine/phosphatidylglycerophosphate/cardiolipin synthase-like enzyme
VKTRPLTMAGGVLVALLEICQFAGPRPVRRIEAVEEWDHARRPIVCVNADGLSVHTYFTPTSDPKQHPEHGIVERLKEAKESVRVQAYGFTSRPIADELIAAKRRGVDVRIVLDRSEVTDMHTMAWACQGEGIPVLFDHAHAIAHNKIIVIDRRWTFTGSYNFTDSAAKRNAENMVMIHSEKIAEQYLENWDDHAKSPHSIPAMPGPRPFP